MLGLAVGSGVFAFVCAALSVYPYDFWRSDLSGTACLAAVLMVFALTRWLASLWRLYPGNSAVWTFLSFWAESNFLGRTQAVVVPPLGSDELAAQALANHERHSELLQRQTELLQRLGSNEHAQQAPANHERHTELLQRQTELLQMLCNRISA